MSALVEQARRGLHRGQAATTTTSFDYALPYLDLEVPELAQAAGINAINRLHIFPPAFLRLELTFPGQQRALTLFAQVKALTADCAASAVLNYRGLNLAAAEFSIEVDCEASSRLVASTAILTEDFKAPTDALTDLSLMSSRNSCPFDANSALLMEPRERYIFINHVTLSQLPDDIAASFPLEAICRSFFREYIAAFGTLRNWCSSVVLFDQEAEDLGLRLAREDNVFVPLIPITNQFAARSSVFSIHLDMIAPPDSLKVVGSIVSAVTDRLGTDVHGKPIQGISPLLPTDLIPISYLRSQGGELFDPLTCFFYFKNLGLVDVNNLLKHRPNLSFKYILNGRHCGHIVAYEGQLEDTVGSNGKDRSSVVYLAELIADGERAPAGAARLISAFIAAYRRAYIDRGVLIPIYAEARESTSYQLLQRHLERITSNLKLSYHMHIVSRKCVGSDRIYCCLITLLANDGDDVGDPNL